MFCSGGCKEPCGGDPDQLGASELIRTKNNKVTKAIDTALLHTRSQDFRSIDIIEEEIRAAFTKLSKRW